MAPHWLGRSGKNIASLHKQRLIDDPRTCDPERVLDDVLDGLITTEEVRRDYSVVIHVQGDVAAASGVATIIKAAGEIDILVKNVGIFEIKDDFTIPDKDWPRMFETNVLSGVRLVSPAAASLSICMTDRPNISSDGRDIGL